MHRFRRSFLVISSICCCLVTGLQSILQSLDESPVVHYTLERRGGPFRATLGSTDCANFTYLTQQIETIESRFNLTKRAYQGNRLIRKTKTDESDGKSKDILINNVAETGSWFAELKIGEPHQQVPMDLDLLSADFYMLITTSHSGTRYTDIFSKTFKRSTISPFPYCTFPSDQVHLPTVKTSMSMDFAYCRPPKSSLSTLGPSGSKLGLAPFDSVSQTHATSLLSQLLEKKVIERPVFSIMLIDGDHGILSLGGTVAPAVELVEAQTKAQLDHIGSIERGKIPDGTPEPHAGAAKRGDEKDVEKKIVHWDTGFFWTHVQGAEGWWQILLQGIWIDGVKVLKNQAAIIDLNSPLTLGPPLPISTLYASMSSTSPLSYPRKGFYSFPCLNPPLIEFELAGKRFPFSSSMVQTLSKTDGGIPGGKLSLGRLDQGSGYCVGGIVETRMGVRDIAGQDRGHRRSRGGTQGNRATAPTNHKVTESIGLKDVWVLGESFFRGVGVVFDVREKMVGFRAF